MKLASRFIALFLLFYFPSFSQDKYKVGIIGFYNLENLYDTIDQPGVDDAEFLPNSVKRYNGKIYSDKLNKLSDIISQIGTDVSPDGVSLLGVAEVENKSVLEDLAKQPSLKNRNYKIVHYNSPDLRGVDVALLYNPKYFLPKFSEPLFVPLFENDSARYTRDVLYVKGMYDGEPMHIFVNHWPSRRGGEEASAPNRAAAASVCRKKIDSIMTADANAKIILMGDLNDDPVNLSVTKVLDAGSDAEEGSAKSLFNPWHSFYKSGVGTLAYNDSWNLFDQIIISKPLLEKNQQGFFFKEALIYRKNFMVQKSGRFKGYPMRTWDFNRYLGGYSDHFPTYVILVKKV